MVSVLRHFDQRIYAYIEWEIVDKKGQFEEGGECCYIADCWIHPKERRRFALDGLIKEILKDERSKSIEWVYWTRTKYKGRLSKLHRIERFTNGKQILNTTGCA